ncbi:S8 family serine peptidase [Halocatena salina]|uniref:S8 family serine peptidase n=1 Tax=Halocatena salina TaxID=2934340 RepID=A0A8U0A8L5_9EURY|nr:S8 family serine peptidase [Halocatena salina]UPM44828.1 S8 family serine peptidase [Halocatena salina]
MTAPFIGMLGAGQQAGDGSISSTPSSAYQNIDDGQDHSNLNGPIEQSTRPDQPGATIDPALTKSEGTVTVVVRLETADVPMTASRQAAIQSLKRHAQQTQRPVLRVANQNGDGVTVLSRLWIANAVLLEVDKNDVSLQSIAQIEGVKRLHANFELGLPQPMTSETDDGNVGTLNTNRAGATATYNTTYGLDQIHATEVWNEYDTMGQGVKVAVLDTGVDIDHPDIDLYTTNESNETYPGGWAEFDSNGTRVKGSVPHDTDQHGTHTSGTVSGGNTSGEYIGVAPDVSLMHGLVLPDGEGTFTQIAAGMQWAVANDADVVSMSFGSWGYHSALIEPTQNIEAAGAIPVAATGNFGGGNSDSPGNVYDAVAVGASNETRGIASFSSGEVVNTPEDWGEDAPDDWPDSYVVPDVAAPGVDVKSAIPGDDYAELSGTSMATPHTAGTVALMLSAAGGDLPTGEIKSTLFETAFKPEECSPSCDPRDGNDTRYGAGIINATAATDRVAAQSGITGTVTDASGAPIEDAAVSTPSFTVETNASGQYILRARPGTYDVSATAFGYENATASVTVENGTFTTQNFTLVDALGVRIVSGQPPVVEGGESASVTAEVANLDTYTAELTGNYSPTDATLYVNGIQQPFGEPIFLGGYSGDLNVAVETTSGTAGELSVTHTFHGEGDTIERTTGPTEVFAEVTDIAVVDSDQNFGDQVVTVLEEELPAQYRITLLEDQNAMEGVGAYDTFVMQDVDPADLNVQAFVAATDSPATGVVWLDNWGSDSNAIRELSNATGDPARRNQSNTGSATAIYNVTKSHPIFEDVAEPGETVAVHNMFWSARSWFTNYSGQVIATVGAPIAGQSGPAVAVDPQTRTVLAATLGRAQGIENEHFYEPADQILANAVEYASRCPPVCSPRDSHPRSNQTRMRLVTVVDE